MSLDNIMTIATGLAEFVAPAITFAAVMGIPLLPAMGYSNPEYFGCETPKEGAKFAWNFAAKYDLFDFYRISKMDEQQGNEYLKNKYDFA